MFYVLLTVLFTVYGQLIVKWQVSQAGALPIDWKEKIFFLCKLLMDPWILSGFFAAFLASLCWMIAMTRLQLSYAYPFTSLSFVLVFLLSAFFFYEAITWQKILGIFFIISGVIISSQSK